MMVKFGNGGGKHSNLNNSFFKLIFLIVFFNLFSFASFGAGFQDKENGLIYNFERGILTINKDPSVSDGEVPKDGNDVPKREITQNGVNSVIDRDIFENTTLKEVKIEKGITSIGVSAFNECKSLKSVTIPEGVTSIGVSAFNKCKSLESVTIPEGVTSIGVSAFYNCSSLTSIIIPEGVTSISKHLFNGCKSLESVTIPNSVANISYCAFIQCSKLKSIVIPKNVTNIGEKAFYNCKSLTEIEVDEGNENYKSVNGVLFNKDVTELILYPISKAGTSYIIPEGVTSIGDYAFENCSNLTSVVIPSSVTEIGKNAFAWCSKLESITIPSSVKSIGNGAFEGSALTTVYYIGTAKMWEAIGIGDNNGTLTGAKRICYYNGELTIYGYQEITADDVNKAIGRNSTMAQNTEVTKVEISESTTSIGDYAFANCKSLTSITIPNSVESIGKNAFAWCSNLTSITILEGVRFIDEGAFQSCTSLTEIEVDEGNTEYKSENGVLLSKDGTQLILYPINKAETSYIIPEGVKEIGKNAFAWCSKLESVTITDSVTFIDEEAFANCKLLTSVTISEGVTSIGDYAFNNCSNLTNIVIPSSVTSIGGYAFCACSSLTNIAIPDSVGTIDNGAFERCTSLEDIYFGNGSALTKINCNMFAGCKALKTITIPKSVTTIGALAFHDCKSLKEVLYYGSEGDWGRINIEEQNNSLEKAQVIYNVNVECKLDDDTGKLIISGTGKITIACLNAAIKDRSKVETVIIEDGITGIGDKAFENCSNLTSVTIPSSVKSIGEGAFSGCSSLTTVYYLGTEDMWEEINKGANNGTLTGAKRICYYDGKLTISGYQEITADDVNKAIKRTDVDKEDYSVKTVIIKDGIGIGNNAFKNCKSLESVTISEGVRFIDEGAFEECSVLKSVTIPDSVTEIGGGAFFYCIKLTSVNLSKHFKLTEIKYSTFEGCTELNEITMANNIKKIGSDAFAGCKKLSSGEVYYYGSEKEWEELMEKKEGGNSYLESAQKKYNRGVVYNFDSDTGVLTISGKGEITQDKMNEDVKDNIENITQVIIGKEITGIGNNAFSGCSSLTSIIIPSSVTSIGDYAFADCESLVTVGYCGSSKEKWEEEWDKLLKKNTGTGNERLKNVDVTYVERVQWSGSDEDEEDGSGGKKTFTVTKIWNGDGYGKKIGYSKAKYREKPELEIYAKDADDDDFKELKEGKDKDYELKPFTYATIDGDKLVEFNQNNTVKITNEGAMKAETWKCEIVIYNYDNDKEYRVVEQKMTNYKTLYTE